MQPIIKRNRKLVNEADLFSQNAWDDTEWTSDMLEAAKERIEYQKEESKELKLDVEKIELNVTRKWDEFYTAHGDKFFKDRKWIFSEFPEILTYLNSDSSECNIFEVGCGVGNAVAHMIDSNQNSKLHIYCCDLSHSAIDTLKKRTMFQKIGSGQITAFRANIVSDFDEIISKKIPSGSLNFITLVFTLSALKPEIMKSTISNLASLLKPEGMLLFRDYAQNDLTQLRFKGKSYLRDNYYVRADGTTSFFFSEDFVETLFTSAGLKKIDLKLDNRMLVNRSKSLKMCRCWIQAKFKKL